MFSLLPMSTYHAGLELSAQASATGIRRAYLRLVRRTPAPAAHQRYPAVNEAYATLSNPIRRQRYNVALQQTR